MGDYGSLEKGMERDLKKDEVIAMELAIKGETLMFLKGFLMGLYAESNSKTRSTIKAAFECAFDEYICDENF